MKIIYTAGVIVDDTYDKVLNCNEWANKYVDHMTIQFGGLTERPEYIGRELNFMATHVVSDDKGMAWIGYIDDSEIAEKMKKLRQHAHITLFTAEGVKPMYSNELIQTAEHCELGKPVAVKMIAGMYVVYGDGSTGWEF